jgi:hypothetical protein
VRRGAWVVLLVIAVPPAWGDVESEERSTSGPPDGPGLVLDPLLRSRLVGLGAVEDGERTELEIGPHTRLVLDGGWWSNDDEDPRHPLIDSPGRGWEAGLRLSHGLGPVTIGASASVNQIDAQRERGRHVDVGLSLGRSVRLSRWMIGWVSLGIGRRRWLGDAPEGESDASQVMLTIGTTFR